MTVDDHVGSPFQDRVYVTWTSSRPTAPAYIYEAYSSDYGEHFSRAAARQHGQPALRVHLSTSDRDAAGQAATRTSSRSRSRAPTAALYVV